MTLPLNDRLRELEHELKVIRTELIEVRRQQKQRTIKRQWLLRTVMIGVSLILIGSWTWSAQASNPIVPDIEKRLSALERLIRKGPANTTQVSGPFDVVGPDGKAILRVASGTPTAGAVAIWSSPDKPGRVAIRSDKGTVLAELGIMKEGYGSVSVADEEGVTRAQLYGAGRVEVLNEEKKIIAGMGAIKIVGMERVNYLSEIVATGRVAVLDDNGAIRALLNNSGQVIVSNEDQKPVGKMEATDEGLGALTIMNAEGKEVAKMGADKGNKAGKLSIMNSAGSPVVGLIGGGKGGGTVAVANATSMPLAEMSVSGDGARGSFQVNKDQKPIAVLTEAIERPGGLLQIFNSIGPVANVTVGEGGGGYFQLSNTAGTPNIEAGSLPDGRGTIRTGPLYKCAPTGTPLFQGGGIPDCLVAATGRK